MKANEVKVVIPIYREKLTQNEDISFRQCKKILNRYPLCIVKPVSLSLQIAGVQGMEIEEFEDIWFQSIQTYNDLMLSEQFYERFRDYKYILIHQLDAFVFRDELYNFCALDYDYIGAPWLYGQFVYINGESGYYYTGNGGLSLRKVESHLSVLKERQIQNIVNEDMFFSSRNQNVFRTAPIEIALEFAFEANVKECFERNHEALPFGCHAWQKYDFEFYRPIFQEMGYDTSDIQDGEMDWIRRHTLCDYSKLTEKNIREALQALLPDMENEIWIWGAGWVGKKCGWMFQRSHIHVKGFIDGNVHMHGVRLFGKEISSSTEYFQETGKALLLIAMNHVPEEIVEELYGKGKREGKDYILWKKLLDRLCI